MKRVGRVVPPSGTSGNSFGTIIPAFHTSSEMIMKFLYSSVVKFNP